MQNIKYQLLVLFIVLFAGLGKGQTKLEIIERKETILENQIKPTTTLNQVDNFGIDTTTNYYDDTTGELGVDDFGNANYTLNIAVPPSIKDLAPKLSLNYKSGTFGGLAGEGWNLQGISTITRTPSRKDIDGFIDGVDGDTHDRFALDGQQLILVSGVYGQANSTYTTEFKSNIKITFKTQDYFEVTYPDGSRAWFGNYNGQTYNNIEVYRIVRYEDKFGNYIKYEYKNFDGNAPTNPYLYVSKIVFSANGMETPLNEIKFTYKQKNRKDLMLNTRTLPTDTQGILQQIEVLTGGKNFKKYVMNYTTGSANYERITSLEEYTGVNLTPSNPVFFEYNTSPDNVTSTETTYDNLYLSSGRLSGDYDGDGRLDFIVSNQLYTNLFNGALNGITLPYATDRISVTKTLNAFNKLNPFHTITKIESNTNEFIFNTYAITTLQQQKKVTIPNNGFFNYVVGDFNGDGISEVLLEVKIGSYPYSSEIYLIDLKNTNNEFTKITNSTIGDFSIKYLEFIADFNGDGKDDLFLLKDDGYTTVIGCVQNDLGITTGFETYYSYYNANYKNTSVIHLGDFNGDGHPDVMSPENNGSSNWKVYYHHTTTTKSENYSIVNYNLYIDLYKTEEFVTLDINKDGKTDLVKIITRRFKSGDWFLNPDYDSEFSVRAYTNMGNGFQETHYFSKREEIPEEPSFIYGDYQYHNKNSDIVFFTIHSNNINLFSFNKNIIKDNQLKSVTESYGKVKKTIDYTPFTKDVVENNDKATYPFVEIKEMPKNDLVSKLSLFANGKSIFKDYKYKSFVMNYNGLGLLGFQKTATTDWYEDSNIQKVWNLKIKDPLKRGAVVKEFKAEDYKMEQTSFESVVSYYPKFEITFITKTTPKFEELDEPSVLDDGQPDLPFFYTTYLSRTDHTYEEKLAPNKVYTLNLKSSITKDLINNTLNKTENTYEPTYNNLTQQITSSLKGALGSTTVTYDYFNNPTGIGKDYYIGRPKSIKTTTTAYGDTKTSEKTFEYLNNNLQKTTTKGHNTPTSLIEEFTYNKYGYLLTQKVSSTDATEPTSLTTYIYDPTKDPTNRFVYKVTDTFGQVIENTNYNIFAQVGIQKDLTTGITTTNTYDDTGKLTKTTVKGNSKNEVITNIASTRLNGGERGISKTSNVDEQSEVNILDLFGNRIKSSKKSPTKACNRMFSNDCIEITVNWISKIIEYDLLGRKVRESEPYSSFLEDDPFDISNFFSLSKKWNTINYDYLNRPTKTTTFSGKVTEVKYEGLKTTTTSNDGKKSIVILDELGNKTSTEDNGGVINYEYYADGLVKKTKYNEGTTAHEINYKYDGWGNQTELNDPSAGKYTYSYNTFGQLKTQTSPKGTTTYYFDTKGRPDKTTYKGLTDGTNYTTQNTYHPTYPTVLQKETSTGTVNDSYTYLYDDLTYKFRPMGMVEENSNAKFETRFSYDDFGRILTQQKKSTFKPTGFSSDVTTINVFNSFTGAVEALKMGTTELWRLNKVNEKFQTIEQTFGNGLKENNTYDTNFFLQNQTLTNSAGTTLTTNTYEFNPITDNLKNRKLGANFKENFVYEDAFDRLTNWTNPVTNANEFSSYDKRGRILNNSQTGLYAYKSDKIYQKDNVTLNTEGTAHYQKLGGTQQLTFNMFRLPVTINESGKFATKFLYNGSATRSVMDYGLSGGVYKKHKYYSDDASVEIVKDDTTNSVKIITYLGGDGYTAPAVHIKTATSNSTYYLHRDHLGSINTISDALGKIIENRTFDAWGNLVKLQIGGVEQNLSLLTTSYSLLIDRGYTGHEHLWDVGLINMNARLYDSKLHQFLSCDNFVQDPTNTQNYNRYGYVLNNPLKYNDPTGNEYDAFKNWANQNFESSMAKLNSTLGRIQSLSISGVSSTSYFDMGIFDPPSGNGTTGEIQFGTGEDKDKEYIWEDNGIKEQWNEYVKLDEVRIGYDKKTPDISINQNNTSFVNYLSNFFGIKDSGPQTFFYIYSETGRTDGQGYAENPNFRFGIDKIENWNFDITAKPGFVTQPTNPLTGFKFITDLFSAGQNLGTGIDEIKKLQDTVIPYPYVNFEKPVDGVPSPNDTMYKSVNKSDFLNFKYQYEINRFNNRPFSNNMYPTK